MNHHTPGPWTIVVEGNLLKIDAANSYVAYVAAKPDTKGRMGSGSEIEQANARIIAAAPALLAALEAVAGATLKAYAGSGEVALSITREHLEDARAAIRQAKGESA